MPAMLERVRLGWTTPASGTGANSLSNNGLQLAIHERPSPTHACIGGNGPSPPRGRRGGRAPAKSSPLGASPPDLHRTRLKLLVLEVRAGRTGAVSATPAPAACDAARCGGCNAAEQLRAELGAAIGAHHQHVGLQRLAALQDRRADTMRGVQQQHLGIMPCRVRCTVRSSPGSSPRSRPCFSDLPLRM